MSEKNSCSQISLLSVYPEKSANWFGKKLLNVADKLMGLPKLKCFYENSHLPGLSAIDFSRELMRLLKTNLMGTTTLHKRLPETGPCIIVANHPFGCVEGIALAHEVAKQRKDVKVLANRALSMFEEIRELFIFIDPLSPKAASNTTALKLCKQHVLNGGVLIVFPSGKVSEYFWRKGRVCDGPWNRVAAHLAKTCDAPVLPVFFEGQNSALFIQLAKVWSKFKLFMLFREVFTRQGQPIKMHVGSLLSPELMSKVGNLKARDNENLKSSRGSKSKDSSAETLSDYLRLQTYLLDQRYFYLWPEDQIDTLKPLATRVERKYIKAEIDALPEQQKLVEYKGFAVYYGYQYQMPQIVNDIARERERVFRLHNEGSGEPIDTDSFDATYVQMFIIDQQSYDIIGAYRMGRTDELIKNQGIKGLYLNKMFSFREDFVNQLEPCLEMGRSFIVPEHQRSFYGLYLLWRGIGEFVVRHPQYRTLYGTVSLSKLYNPNSIEAIRQLALQPSEKVLANSPFNVPINPELSEFTSKHQSKDGVLSLLVKGIELDGKDTPILLKQYQKMGARFYCIGIDKSFNDTPGMLLSVHLPSAPERSLRQYLDKGLNSYLAHVNN